MKAFPCLNQNNSFKASKVKKKKIIFCENYERVCNKKQINLFLLFLFKAPIVRHEAGEALAAIGDFSVIPLLEEYAQDEVKEVAGKYSHTRIVRIIAPLPFENYLIFGEIIFGTHVTCKIS